MYFHSELTVLIIQGGFLLSVCVGFLFFGFLRHFHFFVVPQYFHFFVLLQSFQFFGYIQSFQFSWDEREACVLGWLLQQEQNGLGPVRFLLLNIDNEEQYDDDDHYNGYDHDDDEDDEDDGYGDIIDNHYQIQGNGEKKLGWVWATFKLSTFQCFKISNL